MIVLPYYMIANCTHNYWPHIFKVAAATIQSLEVSWVQHFYSENVLLEFET